MKRKILVGLLAVGLCLMITGCGKEKTNIDENNQQQENNGETELYSNENKIVFDFSGVYKIVFYYSGKNITDYKLFYDYQDPSTASLALESIKKSISESDEVESVEQNGKYIVVKYKKSRFTDMTVDDVRATYSYLQEVKKDN